MIKTGTYLKIDQNSGWSVVAVDEWGNERRLDGPFPTMEDAARAAVTATYTPLLIPFSHP